MVINWRWRGWGVGGGGAAGGGEGTKAKGIGYRSTPKGEIYKSICSNEKLFIEIDGPW